MVNFEGKTPLQDAVVNFDKAAVSFAVTYNKKQREAGNQEGLFDLNSAEKYGRGYSLLHLACSLPSLAIILELTNSEEVNQIALCHRLKLPCEVVPMNYLTSKKTIRHSIRTELVKHFREKPQSPSLIYKTTQVPIKPDNSGSPLFKRITIGSKTMSSKHLSMLDKPRPLHTEVAEGISAQKVLSLDVKASKTDASIMQRKSFINFKDSLAGPVRVSEEKRPTLKHMKLLVRMPKQQAKKKEGTKELIDEIFVKVGVAHLVQQ